MKRTAFALILLAIFARPVFSAGFDDIRTLGYEGEKLYRAANAKAAIEKWEQGLALSRKTKNGKLVSYFLVNLGSAYTDTGNYGKALDAVNEALPAVKKLGDKSSLASVCGSLGNIYQGIGEYQKAAAYYDEAVLLFRETADRQGEATALANLGKVYAECEDFEKAIANFNGAFEIMRVIRDREGLGTVLGNLGIVYKNLGQYHKAGEYYEEALKIFKENSSEQGIAVTLTNLGVVSYNLGDYDKAIANFEESLASSKLRGDNNGIANNLGNLGAVYKDLGDYEKAVSFFERALEIFIRTGLRPKIMENYARLGAAYISMQDMSRAKDYYREGLKLFEDMDYRPGIARCYLGLGLALAETGEYEEALLCCRKALELKKSLGLGVREEETAIADIYLVSGDTALAEKEYLRLGYTVRLGQASLKAGKFREAGGYFQKALKDDLVNREAKYLFAEYCGLGHSFSGLGLYLDADENYRKAIELAENQREQLGPGERTRFFAARVEGFMRSEPYEGIVRTLVARREAADALYYSENLKARALAEAIAGGRAISKELPPEIKEREQVFDIRLRSLRKEMEALYRNELFELYADREKELAELKSGRDKFISKLRKSNPAYAAVRYPKPVKARELKLYPGETLLEFEVTDEKTYLFIVDGKSRSVLVKTIPRSRKALQEMVVKYRAYFKNINKASDLAAYNPAAGKELCDALLGGIVDDLPKGSKLIIVPDEALGLLSFESLVIKIEKPEKRGEGKYGPFPLGVEYLGDRFSITYAQSAASLTLLRALDQRHKAVKPSVIAVCDPVFSAGDQRYGRTEAGFTANDAADKTGAISGWRSMGVDGTKSRGAGPRPSGSGEEIFPRLEKTLEIAGKAEEIFKGSVLLLTGLKACEESVVGLPFSDYSYVVFGTHGILDDTVPLVRQPALVLSLVDNKEGFDGFLAMNEVMGLKIPAEVVALTACETGIGENVSGEGVMGMGRAFQFAGCRNVLMSLWPSAEDGTVALVNAFLEELKVGKTPAEALRAARKTVRGAGFEHPFYWSAFVLVSR